jgi:pimeloyl-ACP methyl ester carboxylesterase
MSESLPTKKTIATRFGDIAYLETGSSDKPPVLFVHGIPTSSLLWRHVLRFLQENWHCYAPDLMGLGDTTVDPTRASFHMEAQAEMLLEFMGTLGHETFTLVCHDQGGAAAQIIAARTPDRLTALVLTDCVAYDNWPVPIIARLQRASRVPGLQRLVSQKHIANLVGENAFRRGLYRPDRLDEGVVHEYLRPLHQTRAGRQRFLEFLRAGHPRYTELAVAGLRKFDKPTLVLWAADDHYLSPSWGKRLEEDIPGARRLELIPFCGHFWQEERPSEFSSHIEIFLRDVHASKTNLIRKKTSGKRRRKKPLTLIEENVAEA